MAEQHAGLRPGGDDHRVAAELALRRFRTATALPPRTGCRSPWCAAGCGRRGPAAPRRRPARFAADWRGRRSAAAAPPDDLSPASGTSSRTDCGVQPFGWKPCCSAIVDRRVSIARAGRRLSAMRMRCAADTRSDSRAARPSSARAAAPRGRAGLLAWVEPPPLRPDASHPTMPFSMTITSHAFAREPPGGAEPGHAAADDDDGRAFAASPQRRSSPRGSIHRRHAAPICGIHWLGMPNQVSQLSAHLGGFRRVGDRRRAAAGAPARDSSAAAGAGAPVACSPAHRHLLAAAAALAGAHAGAGQALDLVLVDRPVGRERARSRALWAGWSRRRDSEAAGCREVVERNLLALADVGVGVRDRSHRPGPDEARRRRVLRGGRDGPRRRPNSAGAGRERRRRGPGRPPPSAAASAGSDLIPVQSPAPNSIGSVVRPSESTSGTWPPLSGRKTIRAPAISKSSIAGAAPVASTIVSQAIATSSCGPSRRTTEAPSTPSRPSARPIIAPARIFTPEAARRAQPAASTASGAASTSAATSRAGATERVRREPSPPDPSPE